MQQLSSELDPEVLPAEQVRPLQNDKITNATANENYQTCMQFKGDCKHQAITVNVKRYYCYTVIIISIIIDSI